MSKSIPRSPSVSILVLFISLSPLSVFYSSSILLSEHSSWKFSQREFLSRVNHFSHVYVCLSHRVFFFSSTQTSTSHFIDSFSYSLLSLSPFLSLSKWWVREKKRNVSLSCHNHLFGFYIFALFLLFLFFFPPPIEEEVLFLVLSFPGEWLDSLFLLPSS